jgi:Right handed beta helix region
MTGSGTGAGIRMRPAAAGDIVYDFADISGFHEGIVDQAPGSVIASTGTAGVVEDNVGDGIVIQASRIYLENIHSDNNYGNGVVVEPLAPATVVSNVYIDKTESSNNTGAGFVLQRLSTFTARLSHAGSNGTDGFDLTNSINAIFTDGYSFQNLGDGMKIVGGHDDIVRAESLGAIYEGNHADGLEIRRSVLDTVDDSAMDHNAGEGLLIAKGKSENITSDESAYNAETGVHLRKTASSRVEELESYNNGGAGIWLEASRAISVEHLIASYNSTSGVYIGCSSAQEPDGTTCASLGLASSDKNLVFNNLNRYNDIGIGIDKGNHKNRVLNNQTSSNSTYDLEDWASACDSNVWMFNTFTKVSPASCIH